MQANDCPCGYQYGFRKLELEFKTGGHEDDLIKLFGGTISGNAFRFNGAYQHDDDDSVDAVELVCRGRIAEIDEGSSKAGNDTEHSYKASLTYYKKTVNGVDIIEIDTLNQIYIVDGKDRLAEIRKAMVYRFPPKFSPKAPSPFFKGLLTINN
ncbi:phage major tail tube protein [Mannheimia haemolytica]|uniref:Phage major tail tube protein n=1 Tax=Mannheimia haemolytica TaxID=75985 RepID=A0A378PU11_MANHA|nr:phage major tail tube protein [Mannheimia haemolytica]